MTQALQKIKVKNDKMTFYVTPEIREFFDREASYKGSSKSAVLQDLISKIQPKENIIQQMSSKSNAEIGTEFETTLQNIKSNSVAERSVKSYQKMFG